MPSVMYRQFPCILALLATSLIACGDPSSDRPSLVVYAAASLRDVAVDFATEFEQRRSPPASLREDTTRVVYNFAGSNTLAQQIRAAPGADVFLSADEEWVDDLEQAGRIVAGSRRVFLSNRLVLVARRDADFRIDNPRDLAVADLRFLALADPRAVPAGRYARAALEGISWNGGSLWSALADRIAPSLDVRAALALVESDPEIAGIVYQTDAMTSDEVRILYELSSDDDVPIRYSAALVAGGESPELGRRFLEYLISPAARAIAERHGFLPATEPP